MRQQGVELSKPDNIQADRCEAWVEAARATRCRDTPQLILISGVIALGHVDYPKRPDKLLDEAIRAEPGCK